jgi:hypothetical protein
MTHKTYQLFIAYSSLDAHVVDNIAQTLAQLKYDDGAARYITWQDKYNLPPATPHWWGAIAKNIRQSISRTIVCKVHTAWLNWTTPTSAICQLCL